MCWKWEFEFVFVGLPKLALEVKRVSLNVPASQEAKLGKID